MVLIYLDRGTAEVPQKMDHFNTAKNYPHTFLFPVYNQGRRTKVKKKTEKLLA
jgi:hypothetical protein